MKDFLKKYPYLFAVPVVLMIAVFFFLTREPEEETVDPALFSTESSIGKTTESSSQEWYVDVKGAVKKTVAIPTIISSVGDAFCCQYFFFFLINANRHLEIL